MKLIAIGYGFSIVTAEDLQLEQRYVKTVFLHSDLEEHLHVATTWVYHAWEGATGLQAKQESLWLETGSEAVVSEV